MIADWETHNDRYLITRVTNTRRGYVAVDFFQLRTGDNFFDQDRRPTSSDNATIREPTDEEFARIAVLRLLGKDALGG